jgi:hypothetical protein
LEQFQQISFFHLHTCVYSICMIFTLLYHFPTSWFCIREEEEKKWHFWLFKIAKKGVSLWHLHAYMYYSLIWFISWVFSDQSPWMGLWNCHLIVIGRISNCLVKH